MARIARGSVVLVVVSALTTACQPSLSRDAVRPANADATTIIARHIEALGGADAIESVRSVRFEVQIVEPAFTLTGDYRATRDGRMRIDVYAGEQRVFSEGIDAQGPWQQHGVAAPIEPVSTAGQAALTRGVENNLWGLYDLASRGHRATLHGRETIEGVDYYVLQFVTNDGFERYLYINPATWMIERQREVSALHPDIDNERRPAQTVNQRFSVVCGTKRPSETYRIDLLTGEEIQRTRILSSQCNTAPADLQLARPQPAS